jgi:hypothetical protein
MNIIFRLMQMKSTWNEIHVHNTTDTECSLTAVIHMGQVVGGLRNNGVVPRFIFHGEALDVARYLAANFDVETVSASTFKVILTDHVATLINNSGKFIVEPVARTPLNLVSSIMCHLRCVLISKLMLIVLFFCQLLYNLFSTFKLPTELNVR